MAFEDRIVEHPGRVQMVEVTAPSESFAGDGVTTDFELTATADSLTAVTVDGETVTNYIFNNNKIIFTTAPADGTVINATFTASGLYDLIRAEGEVIETGTLLNAENLTQGVEEITASNMQGITIDNLENVSVRNIQSGTVSITSVANTVVTKSVTFATPFTSVPRITVTPVTTVPNRCSLGVSNVTTNGFTINLYRTNVSTTSINWIAIL